MAGERDMGNIGPGIRHKVKLAQRLSEPLVQSLQRRGYFGCTQHRQAMWPEPGLVEHQFKRLKRNSCGGCNRVHLGGCHIADELQGDMPVGRRIRPARLGPGPKGSMIGKLLAHAIVRPQGQNRRLV